MHQTSTPTHVTDRRGARYALGELIGEGAQGRVFAVEGHARLAVKLVNDRDPDALRHQFAFVRHLPLQKLRVARPLELLQEPHLGYVMERLDGKASLRKTLYWRNDGDRPAAHYIASGGLLRRYRLLADLAALLEALHNDGLAYGDLSPDNVFASLDVSQCDTHLIDADNLRRHTAHGRSVYTPRYGAPEVVRGEAGVSTLTDAHAFAALAFEVLCFVHPLIGALVEDGEPELEEQALRGELPWIDHPTDDRNRPDTYQGIPREFVLTGSLRELFGLTFEQGLRDPRARPGVGEWRRALEQAAANVISCPQCERSALFEGPPWCTHPRPAALQIAAAAWHPDFDLLGHPPARTSNAWVLRQGDTHTLTEAEARLSALAEPLLRVRLATKDGASFIVLQNVGSTSLLLRSPTKGDKEVRPGDRAQGFPVDEAQGYYVVHAGPLHRPHTVFTFTYSPEGARATG